LAFIVSTQCLGIIRSSVGGAAEFDMSSSNITSEQIVVYKKRMIIDSVS